MYFGINLHKFLPRHLSDKKTQLPAASLRTWSLHNSYYIVRWSSSKTDAIIRTRLGGETRPTMMVGGDLMRCDRKQIPKFKDCQPEIDLDTFVVPQLLTLQIIRKRKQGRDDRSQYGSLNSWTELCHPQYPSNEPLCRNSRAPRESFQLFQFRIWTCFRIS